MFSSTSSCGASESFGTQGELTLSPIDAGFFFFLILPSAFFRDIFFNFFFAEENEPQLHLDRMLSSLGLVGGRGAEAGFKGDVGDSSGSEVCTTGVIWVILQKRLTFGWRNDCRKKELTVWYCSDNDDVSFEQEVDSHKITI